LSSAVPGAHLPGTFYPYPEDSSNESEKMHRLAGAFLAVLSLTVLSTASHATSVQQMSVVDLLDHSQDIVADVSTK
jgi:hypothetical protein